MLSICALTMVLYFYAGSSVVYGQEPAAGSPKTPAKTATPTKQETQEVVFGTFKNYKHSSGWFSMSAPENWTINETSIEGEYIISIIDPTENGAFVARVWSSQDRMTEDELSSLLKKFLNYNLSDFPNFKLGDSTQKNKRVGIRFTYDSIIDEKSYPMIGDSFIEQKESIVGLSNLMIPKDQYDKKINVINKMMNSININPGNTR